MMVGCTGDIKNILSIFLEMNLLHVSASLFCSKFLFQPLVWPPVSYLCFFIWIIKNDIFPHLIGVARKAVQRCQMYATGEGPSAHFHSGILITARPHCHVAFHQITCKERLKGKKTNKIEKRKMIKGKDSGRQHLQLPRKVLFVEFVLLVVTLCSFGTSSS